MLAMTTAVNRAVLLLSLCGALAGCVREEPDSRLDDNGWLDPKDRAALLTLDCSQRREEIVTARDEAADDSERVANYRQALKALQAAAVRLEEAFTRQPDLLYASEGDALRLRLQRCQSQARTITEELRKFELAVRFKPSEPERIERPSPPPSPPKKQAVKKTRIARHTRHRAQQAVLAVR